MTRGGLEGTVAASRAGPEDRLRDIQAITDAALSRLDDHDLLAERLERTRAIFQADTAAVLLPDFSSAELIATAAAGLEKEVRQGVRIPVGQDFAGRIAAEHQPVILDHADHTTVLNPILQTKGIRALMGVPLIASGNVIGVLHVGSLTAREFTSENPEVATAGRGPGATAVQSLMAQDDRVAARAPLRGDKAPDVLVEHSPSCTRRRRPTRSVEEREPAEQLDQEQVDEADEHDRRA